VSHVEVTLAVICANLIVGLIKLKGSDKLLNLCTLKRIYDKI